MDLSSRRAARFLLASFPRTEGFNVGGRAVAQPAIELRLVLELLAAVAVDLQVPAVEIRQSRHIAPELLVLRHREDVLLPVAPSALHVFEGDVGRHARADGTDRFL